MVPPSFTPNLPSKSLSIAQLLEFDLPQIADPTFDPMDIDIDRFSDNIPTPGIEEVLPFLAVPTRSELRQFLTAFGQAWFDGRQLLRTWVNPDLAFPFWVLSYWAEVLDTIEAKDCWTEAALWLRMRANTDEELIQRDTAQELWGRLGWHGDVKGSAGLSVSSLAVFFSDEYLKGVHVNALLAILSMRLKSVAGNHNTVIVIVNQNTTFAQMVNLLLPRKDGTLAIASHPGAQRYLKKYTTWFQSPDHTKLHLVLHRPPEHWTACAIDFHAAHIHYGDGLHWERPKGFFTALGSWTAENFPETKFQVTDNLPCAIQTDSYSCPMIAVNAIAHNVLGDPLWTAETADTIRMKAFCDVVKYALSSKVSKIHRH
ncbi:hypothetical protein C8R46DRAFT_1032057 [Mycena filopes]|nr:hypothetical protein C8R46DRAFT_1032057 [Mycena filopes]